MSTEVREQQGNTTTFAAVPDGKAGNYRVAAKMVRLVRDSVMLDEGLERWLKQRMVDAGLDSHSPNNDLFGFVFDLVRSSVKYIEDIAGSTESIKDARRTLQDGFGDCDDQAVVVATLLAMLDFEPSFVVSSTEPDIFQHVYTILKTNGKRYVFDTTLTNGELNKEVDAPYTDTIDIFGKVKGLDDLHGLFSGVRHLAKATVRNATDAVGFMPIGFVAKQSIKQFGSRFLNGVTGDDANINSLSDVGSDVINKLSDIIVALQNRSMSIEAAQSQAYEISKDFLALRPDESDENSVNAYAHIMANVQYRLAYINNFGNIAPDAPHANADLMKLFGMVAVGFGIYLMLGRGKG